MNRKKRFIWVSVVITLLVAGIILFFGSRTYTLHKQLDLGQRFLFELEYESALFAYEKALKIDPKNNTARTGLYEATISYVEAQQGGNLSYIWDLIWNLSNYFPEDRDIWHMLLHILENAGDWEMTDAALEQMESRFELTYDDIYQPVTDQQHVLTHIEILRCKLCGEEVSKVTALIGKGSLLNYNGHYYMIVDDELEWTHARAWCEGSGGYLATITTEEEQNFLAHAMIEHGKDNPMLLESYWMGGIVKNGQWCWISEEPFDYSHWAPGEPNGNEEDMVMQMYTGRNYYDYNHYCWDDTWFDGDKGGGIRNQGLICEWDEKPAFVS